MAKDSLLSNLFRRHARNIAASPMVYILVPLLLAIACTSFVFIKGIKIDTDPNLVWVPPNSKTSLQKNFFDAAFDPFYRIQQVRYTSPICAGSTVIHY